MTEHDFDQRLRSGFRMRADEGASPSLRASVKAVPDLYSPTPRRWWATGWTPPGMNRFAAMALAATVVIIAALIGIGFVLRPANVGPSPVPDPKESSTPDLGCLTDQFGGSSIDPRSSMGTPRHIGWSATANMTTPRSGHSATLLLDGRVLVAGGQAGGNDILASAEIYDPVNGSWAATGSMSWPREGHTATLLCDGKVLVAGGFNLDSNLPYGAVLASAEVYDPVAGTWSTTGGMSTARIGYTPTLLADGYVLVAGGEPTGGGSAFATTELYDPITGTWVASGNMAAARAGHTATLLRNGMVLVTNGHPGGGGGGGYPMYSAEVYDPSMGTWASIKGMTYGGSLTSLLPDGTVFFARDTDSAESYDPRSGNWTLIGDRWDMRSGLPGGVSGLSAAAGYGVAGYRVMAIFGLPDGMVLEVVEGFGSTSYPMGTTAALVDPMSGTGTFLGSGGFGSPRYAGFSVTLLSDGRVLVAGGFRDHGESGIDLASVDLFDPGSGS